MLLPLPLPLPLPLTLSLTLTLNPPPPCSSRGVLCTTGMLCIVRIVRILCILCRLRMCRAKEEGSSRDSRARDASRAVDRKRLAWEGCSWLYVCMMGMYVYMGVCDLCGCM
ncbi:hypothetical protein B484DRAFT_115108 [Ochromonadaceae sp. CCMP2298]|nr:hypothetical protein B484DRAFT_115108 [Ochromonadaceae sp. CCMP2298]